jgi:hypothetical protein
VKIYWEVNTFILVILPIMAENIRFFVDYIIITDFAGVQYTRIFSRVWVTKDGFGLVIGFIEHLQVVTINNHNPVTDFLITKHSTLLSSVYLH